MYLGRNFAVSPYRHSLFFAVTINLLNLRKTTTLGGRPEPSPNSICCCFCIDMKNKMLFDTTDEAEVTLSPSPFGGKDEMNFAEHPIALLTDRVPKGQNVLKFEDQVYDEKKKRLVPRRRIIEGSKEYGLPTATDDLVILALIQLTKLKGDFNNPEVEFTRLELIKMLGWADEGRSYDRIKLSLLRIKGVNYFYDNAWWDGRQKTWTTRAFSIIDNVEINDSRTTHGQNPLFCSRIVWNEVVFGSFQAGFLRNIDFQLCMRLEHPTALRMYRFLGKRFYVQPEWVFDLKEFAELHMGLGRNYEGGTQIVRKLKPAVAELETIGFLEPLAEKERFIKKDGIWSVRFLQKSPASAVLPELKPGSTPEPSPLLEALTSRGVTAKTAADLVQAFPSDFIATKIEEFDWEMTRPKPPKKPAGYLVKSIQVGYAADPNFISTAERKRREETRQARERQEAEDRRQKYEAAQQEHQLAARVKAYRQGRTAGQIAELEAEAVAQASEEVRHGLDEPHMKPFRQMQVTRLTDALIARLIEAEAEMAQRS